MRILFIFPFALLCYFLELNSPSVAFTFSKSAPKCSTHKLVVADTIPPAAICANGIISFTMPTKGYVIVKAKDLDRSSYDNTTLSENLKFYFDGNPLQDSIKVHCYDFVAAGSLYDLLLKKYLYVEDEAGNKDSCQTTLLFQDILDVCNLHPSHYSIRGSVRSENGEYIRFKSILKGPNNYISEQETLEAILYSTLRYKGGYELCLSKNESFLNGVTTADIVKIKRHILEIEFLISPYKLLAADVNRSNTLTGADASEIRRLVLGIVPEFQKVPSWIFVPKEFVFSGNPLDDLNKFIPSCDSIEIKDKSIEDKNYVAIKMGDVTLNARGDYTGKPHSRKNKSTLTYQTTHQDNNFITDFYSTKNTDIQGLQFSLAYDMNLFEFAGIIDGDIHIDAEQMSLRQIDKGKIHIAWDKNPLDKSDHSSGKLFSILWKKKSNHSAYPILGIDPDGIKALLVDQDLNEISLSLQAKPSDNTTQLEIYQNNLQHNIQIQGNLPNETKATYSVMDLTGRVLFTKTIQFDHGILNEIISLDVIPKNSLYFFRIESAHISKTWKILLP